MGMSDSDKDIKGFEGASLDRLMGRDGFSPDLPEVLARRPSAKRLSLGLQVLMYMLRGLRYGELEVLLPTGETRVFKGSERSDLRGVLNIRDARIVGHVLKGGEVGFGEAYLDGCWDSPDLTALLIVLYLNEPHLQGPYEKNVFGRLYGWIQHKRRANTKATAKKNIEYHYDLGNEFYKLWLDETMAYSSGVFSRDESMVNSSGVSSRDELMVTPSGVFSRDESTASSSGLMPPNETLKAAQLNKFRLMFERLDLRPEHHLLEIGSGWGGFAIYAAQHSGCRVTSITLSEEQLKEARVRAEQAGVADRVSFEIRDYRDVRGQYDRIVSIEMYEAVGEEFWPAYFNAIQRALKPGGRAAIQGITIHPEIFEQYRSKRDFIQKYIFPGGMLATPERFMQVAAGAGLKSEDPRYFARDYADTLMVWHRNVLAVRDRVVEQFDERFLRMWRYYLSYCECGFRVERINLMQLTLNKPG